MGRWESNENVEWEKENELTFLPLNKPKISFSCHTNNNDDDDVTNNNNINSNNNYYYDIAIIIIIEIIIIY